MRQIFWPACEFLAFIDALQRLAEEPDPTYRHLQELAHQYVHGNPNQKDESSPTGYWQGMRTADGSWIDWEVFAGLASGWLGGAYICGLGGGYVPGGGGYIGWLGAAGWP